MAASDSSSNERRQTSLGRVPFEALVEIAAPEGTAFEAESLNVSATGMHLRTAYLPKVGTSLRLRFEPGAQGSPVIANGSVVWAQDLADGCEFGVRFDDLRAEGADALRKIVGSSRPPSTVSMGISMPGDTSRAGAPIRIHIEGAQAPMRAALRAQGVDQATVSTELKMLRLGAQVSLEDKDRQERRDARVESVACEIDPTSNIPQLLVRLRYDDAASNKNAASTGAVATRAAEGGVAVGKSVRPNDPTTVAQRMKERAMDSTGDGTNKGARDVMATNDEARDPQDRASPSIPAPTSVQARVSLPIGDLERPNDDAALADASDVVDDDRAARPLASRFDSARVIGGKMKDVLDVSAAAAMRFGLRAKTTIGLLARRDRDDESTGNDEGGDAPRRTTAPAPTVIGGASRTRMLRTQGAGGRTGSTGTEASVDDQANMGGMDGIDEVEGKKIVRRKQLGVAVGVGVAMILGVFAFHRPHAAVDPNAQMAATEIAPAASASADLAIAAPAPSTSAMPDPSASAASNILAGVPTGLDAKGNPNAFGTTTVKKGTHMLLKLDGPITELRGVTTPTGFIVAVPNRKSTEAASPLAAKDPRIASAKVVNQPGGAELTITFKDASPAYVVRAKGDTLEIVLAHDKAVAKKAHGKGHAGAKAAPKK